VVIADNWQGAQRTKLIGYNAAVLTVSVAVFPAVGGILDQAGGWRWSFAPYGLALLTALAVLVWLPRDFHRVASSLRNQLRSAAGAFRQPVVFGSVAFGFVLFALIFGLFLTAMPILLAHEFDLGPRDRGLMLSVPAITSTIAAVVLSRTRARLGASRLLLVANVLFVIGFLTIGLAGAVGIVAVGALIYGFGEGSSIPTVQDLVASRAPEASRGAVVALWVGSARAGQTTGPLLASVSLAHIGPSATFVVGAALTATLLLAQIIGRHLITFTPMPG
jgi:MFS transporter, ACDE family, multidrug resistance protein